MSVLIVIFSALGLGFLGAVLVPLRAGKVSIGGKIIARQFEPEEFWLYVFICACLSAHSFGLALAEVLNG